MLTSDLKWSPLGRGEAPPDTFGGEPTAAPLLRRWDARRRGEAAESLRCVCCRGFWEEAGGPAACVARCLGATDGPLFRTVEGVHLRVSASLAALAAVQSACVQSTPDLSSCDVTCVLTAARPVSASQRSPETSCFAQSLRPADDLSEAGAQSVDIHTYVVRGAPAGPG